MLDGSAFDASTQSPQENAGVAIQLPTNPSGDGTAPMAIITINRGASETLSLDVAWFESSSSIADGDRYTFTMTGADGAVVETDSEVVIYTQSTPNGPSCGPACLGSSVDRRTSRGSQSAEQETRGA